MADQCRHCGDHGVADCRSRRPGRWGLGFPFASRFAGREERETRLEEYVRELETEAQAVRERIASEKEQHP